MVFTAASSGVGSRLTRGHVAFLTSVSSLPAVFASRILDVGDGRVLWGGWGDWLAWIPALFLLVGSFDASRHCRRGRMLMSLSVPSFFGLAAPALTQRPAFTLLLMLVAAAFLVWLWRLIDSGLSASELKQRRARAHRQTSPLGSALNAANGTVLVWLLTLTYAPEAGIDDWISIALSSVITALWGRAAGGPGTWLPNPVVATVASLGWAVSLVCMLGQWAPAVASMGAVLPALLITGYGLVNSVLRQSAPEDEGVWGPILDEPARVLALTFLALGTVGALLLWLPMSHEGDRITLIDAAFTSFSASCVTGLGVVDTPGTFSFVGELVLLLLIQVGGLGIMAFSTATLALLGRRMSVRHEASVAEMFSDEDRGQVFSSLGRMLGVTFAAEAIGWVLLTGLFRWYGDAWGTALWKGLFTAVSAFCNAGFALNSDSLMSYAGSPGVLGVVGLLILVGGTGPTAVVWVPMVLRGRKAPLAVSLTLITSLLLMVVPALMILAVEWNSSLRDLGPIDRLMNAWFQSVTLRTAGFNSVDFLALQPATVMMMIVVMFIGGATGSTAGGIKTSTLAVLALAVYAALLRRNDPVAFGVRIGQATVYKAFAVAFLGLVSAFAAFFALLLTQSLRFEVALFETISALATVGLTIGGTAQLDDIGKLIVIACMFVGRIGPLTIFLLLARDTRRTPWSQPVQEVPVG